MKKVTILLCVFSIVFMAVMPYVSAGDPMEPTKWSTGQGRKDWLVNGATSESYLVKAPAMLFRGLHNVAFGWAEIISQPIRHSRNAPLFVGTATGLVMGPVMAVTRTGSGLVDVLTFWVPKFHGWPLSKPVLGLSS